MEGKRTGTDKSDGNGAIFTLNSNVSEELRRQVKAMQACVGPFLDQDGAEYARRFKEKYGITIDPDEAIVIAQLAISENKSARQKKVAADNSYRAWEYFKSTNPLFDFITEFAGDEFTGTFIPDEFRKYSVKRRQKPNESDAKYRQYLVKRADIQQMYRDAMRENRQYEAGLNKEADAETAASYTFSVAGFKALQTISGGLKSVRKIAFPELLFI